VSKSGLILGSAAVNGVEIVRQIDYQAFSEPKSWAYGSGGQYQRAFDLDGRIKEHRAGSAVRAIRFDPASRIREIDDGPTGANRWSFGCDSLDRLETAVNVGTQGAIANLSVAWEYDPTGNRTSQTLGASPPIPYITAPTSNKLTSVNAVTRQYDAVGNTSNDGDGFTSLYNARNRLVHTTKAALGTNYAHNAFGERVCKSTSGPTCATSPLRTEYVYDDDGHLIGEYAPNLIDHTEILWLADTPIAVLKRRPGSTDGGPVGGGASTPWTGMQAGGVDIYFIHPDHLDTPRALVNANDQPIWLWDSAPFGDTAANEQPTAGLPNFTFNLRFPGQQYDRETGTHYNYFRDYEAQTGRYVQSDPLGLWDGNATFAYVASSPTDTFDPYGLGRCNRYLRALGLCKKPVVPRPSTPIPTGGGIYIFINCHGLVVYVGKASDFKSRMSAHRNDESGQWRAFDDPCCPVIPVFTPVPAHLRDAREKALIDLHRPAGNVQLNPQPRPYAPCC